MARKTAPLVTIATTVFVLVLGGCSVETHKKESPLHDGGGPPASGSGPASSGRYDTVTTGLEAPWSVAFYEDTPLISERDSGRILELHDGKTRQVGKIRGLETSGEGGLLGLAVKERTLYTYSGNSGGNRIQSFELGGAPGDLRLGKSEGIVEGLPVGAHHNGGRLAFGPDGLLYATVGDAGDRDAAQDRRSYAGTILRMKPDGTVPRDNPFRGSLVYSYGHRNPQGLAWAEDGTMYAAEFGQDTWDELNIIEPGKNYGWPVVEGATKDAAFQNPVTQWKPSEASPSAITIVGENLYVANLRGERLTRIPLDDPKDDKMQLDGVGRIRDVLPAPEGGLWVLTNNTDGRGEPGQDDDRLLRIPPDGASKE